MNIFKTTIYAAAAYGTYRLLTDRDAITGKTLLEKLGDEASNCLIALVGIKNELTERVEQFSDEFDAITNKSNTNKRTGEPMIKAAVDPTLGDVVV